MRRNHRRKKNSYAKVLARVKRLRHGKKALARFKRFWKVARPPAIRTFGKGKRILVGLGRSPALYLANGPDKKRSTKIRRIPHRGWLATNPSGTRLWILKDTKKGLGKRKRFAGFVPTTEYVPSAAIEKAGTHKAGTLWNHSHSDDGGRWPRAFYDEYGNVHYAPGTYKISDWIRR